MYKPTWSKIPLLVCLLLVFSSCAPATPSTVSDKEIEEAVAKAHESMNIIRRAILVPDPSRRFVGLKVRFTRDDGHFEDHWTEPVDYYDNVFTIRLLEGFTFDIGLHPNNLTEVSEKDVLDWMIVENDGKLIGGYTIRLTYEHLTPAEKKKFLQTTGYVIK